MNNPLGVSPSKGNQVTTRGKEKIFDLGGNRTHDLRIRSTVTLPTELRGRTEKVGDDLGGDSRRREWRVHMNVVPRSIRTQMVKQRINSKIKDFFFTKDFFKDFFFTSCGYLIPFTRTNAQWVIHGFN